MSCWESRGAGVVDTSPLATCVDFSSDTERVPRLTLGQLPSQKPGPPTTTPHGPRSAPPHTPPPRGPLTRCSWQATKVWNPGATPKPSWSMNGGSSWLWIWTLMPASKDVSSVGGRRTTIPYGARTARAGTGRLARGPVSTPPGLPLLGAPPGFSKAGWAGLGPTSRFSPIPLCPQAPRDQTAGREERGSYL